MGLHYIGQGVAGREGLDTRIQNSLNPKTPTLEGTRDMWVRVALGVSEPCMWKSMRLTKTA